MNNFQTIAPQEIEGNAAERIGKQWMLISAGSPERFNTMTASWGFMGYYANRYCATILVRPERYTYEFLEAAGTFTLSFLPESYRSALSLLGTQSGRDGDKVAQAGLTPLFTPAGNPTFEEAELVVECRTIYGAPMSREGFVDRAILDRWYGNEHGGLHKLYIGEILNVYEQP